jgi:acyl dehydratase
MAKTVIDGIAGLKTLVGKDLGASEWRTLKYEDIVRFADATGDHQWIHVDRERIAKESPFGAPIAHGYYSVSVIAGLFFEVCESKGMAMVINYGLNKVRFPTPLKEGARYRLACKMGEVRDVGNNTYEGLIAATIEIDGSAKPACAAEVVFRFIGK